MNEKQKTFKPTVQLYHCILCGILHAVKKAVYCFSSLFAAANVKNETFFFLFTAMTKTFSMAILLLEKHFILIY